MGSFPLLSITRRFGLVLLVFACLGSSLSLLGVRVAYSASGDYGKIITNAAQRMCPDTRCGTRATIPKGSSVQTWCWRDAGSFNGTNRWFRIRYAGEDGWVSASQMNPQPSVPYCFDLKPDEVLFANQTVWSSNGLYRLLMQADGNLVFYGSVTWASYAAGDRFLVQRDGNLVEYDGSGTAVWSSQTLGSGGTALRVQDDGNLVFYTPGERPVWSARSQLAVQWARGWLGSTAYDNRCLTFVRQSWRSAGVDIGSAPSADSWWRAHQSQMRTDGTPPFGALVVWKGTADYPDGHIAISIGGDQALSTLERSFVGVHIMSISDRNKTKAGSYVGWYLPG